MHLEPFPESSVPVPRIIPVIISIPAPILRAINRLLRLQVRLILIRHVMWTAATAIVNFVSTRLEAAQKKGEQIHTLIAEDKRCFIRDGDTFAALLRAVVVDEEDVEGVEMAGNEPFYLSVIHLLPCVKSI